MKKYATGYCPVVKGTITISADYMDMSSIYSRKWERSLVNCKNRIYGCPYENEDCPLASELPLVVTE